MHRLLLAMVLIGMSAYTHSLYLSTSLFTKHVRSDSYYDKKLKRDVRYNEHNEMLMGWANFKTFDNFISLDQASKFQFGFGRFRNSFYEKGYLAGIVIENHITTILYSTHPVEIYYGYGAVMTNTYITLAYKPIPIFHAGLKGGEWFANIGAYGDSRVITCTVGFKLF